MRRGISTGIGQLQQLLQAYLIPWAEANAPLAYLSTPPLSFPALDIREKKMPSLPPLRPKSDIQRPRRWTDAGVNSVEVPVLGCVYEGENNYIIRAAPGNAGRQWIIPLTKKTFFLIPPGIPFMDSHDLPSTTPYSRQIMIYLRRDGIRCHSYTRDKGKVWLHPYVFIADNEAWIPGDRLFSEMRRSNGRPDAIIYHYLAIVLRSMLRGIHQNIASTLLFIDTENAPAESTFNAPQPPWELVRQAVNYIEKNLRDHKMTARDIASHVGISLTHLNRLFIKEQKMTAMQFLQQKRLDHAQHLLQRSTFQINLIAHLCGFTNQSHFSHWFHKQTGLSPRKYRLSYRARAVGKT